MDIKQFLSGLHIKQCKRKFEELYKRLKPLMLSELQTVLINRRKKQTGRPIKTDLNKFLDALFFLVDTGSQSIYVEKFFQIPKSTFYRYLQIIKEHQILKNLYNQIIHESPLSVPLITDTKTVKSMDGRETVGQNPTDRGRMGSKVSLICDSNRIVIAAHVGAANTHDSQLLKETIKEMPPLQEPIKCLGDSAYVGKELAAHCSQYNLKLIAKPRRTRKIGGMTHQLCSADLDLLKKKRNQIELLNGQIGRFRGLVLKWTKTISTYECFLYVALLCITCARIYDLNS